MISCEQTKEQNVLEHGISVKNYLFDLINYLKTNQPLKHNFLIPKWLNENKNLFLENLPNDKTLELYTTYHDCGKPFCIYIDSEGKKHFPNHELYSKYVFDKVFDNKIASNLILHDMDIHRLKSEDINKFINNPYALTLLLTGLAEIHSNAEMFGGINSVSFKIKHKHITKKGQQIINLIKKN